MKAKFKKYFVNESNPREVLLTSRDEEDIVTVAVFTDMRDAAEYCRMINAKATRKPSKPKYRKLNVGEIINRGDEVLFFGKVWAKTQNAGARVRKGSFAYRRKISA